MAGDWIKLQKDTPDKPEVIAIAARLGIDPDAVVGKLVRVWSWFDTHTTDGNASSVTFALLDRLSGVPGFAEQMALVGWLVQNGHDLSLPNFGYHNGETAKKRALTKNRVEKSRAYDKPECNASSVTKALPEKRREEKNNSVPKGTGAVAPQPKRGSRLSDDWRLPKQWGDWALSEFQSWTEEVVRLEADKFADHWRAKSGKDAVKMDWEATWRNWCRSDIAQRAHSSQAKHGHTAQDRKREVMSGLTRGLVSGGGNVKLLA